MIDAAYLAGSQQRSTVTDKKLKKMNLLSVPTIDFALPLADPVLKFLIILAIILASSLLLNKLKIPHLLGLIVAGAIIGPYGFNLIMRDSSIIMSGTAGLLYIMFLAGLEIDMGDFRRNSLRSLTFGLYTFIIPMLLGTAVSLWVFKFNILSSVLLASMFASHTLIAYPIISRLGITRDKSVSITVGGTMITDTLSLLVLTIIVGMATGNVNDSFWMRLSISVVLFAAVVLFIFPIIARYFFKRVNDSIAQYIFVLAMVFLGAFLAQLAGMESIIGAFLTGLALNRFIPLSSPLMNRVEFVGNAIFIPFFLISVGMLVDYPAFTSWETVKVGLVMIIVATLAKYLAAWLTQKTFRLSTDQRRVIFGLSNAQAAATLAAVIVGYNIITGTDADGEPIRLLNESVLNGTIMMILVTCVMASFSAQKGAHNIAAQVGSNAPRANAKNNRQEHILLPVSNEETVEELVNFCLALKGPKTNTGLYALKVIENHNADEKTLRKSQKVLETAVKTGAAANTLVKDVLRYDLNISNAITSVANERGITDIVVGIKKGIVSDSLGRILENVLIESSVNAFVYSSVQPISTIKRHVVVIPELIEREAGFIQVVNRLWNVISNTGTRMRFFGSTEAIAILQNFFKDKNCEVTYVEFDKWDDWRFLLREVRPDDMIWTLLSRKGGFSYVSVMSRVPRFLSRYLSAHSFVLAYPKQATVNEGTMYLT